jgi:hypothetical protein
MLSFLFSEHAVPNSAPSALIGDARRAEKNSTCIRSFLDLDLSTYVKTFESRDSVPFNNVIFDLQQIFILHGGATEDFIFTLLLTHGNI